MTIDETKKLNNKLLEQTREICSSIEMSDKLNIMADINLLLLARDERKRTGMCLNYGCIETELNYETALAKENELYLKIMQQLKNLQLK